MKTRRAITVTIGFPKIICKKKAFIVWGFRLNWKWRLHLVGFYVLCDFPGPSAILIMWGTWSRPLQQTVNRLQMLRLVVFLRSKETSFDWNVCARENIVTHHHDVHHNELSQSYCPWALHVKSVDFSSTYFRNVSEEIWLLCNQENCWNCF